RRAEHSIRPTRALRTSDPDRTGEPAPLPRARALPFCIRMDAPPPTPRTRYERAKALTRSGLRRYPRTILRAFGWDRPGRVGPPKPEPAIDRHSIASVWLGHATALLRVGGLNILTDPVLSERIGPGMGRLRVGIPRLAPVPIDP